jgi:hypothetical protein
MADTETLNYQLVKPEVGGSFETWGNKINGNLDVIDTKLKENNTLAAAAMPKTGGTFTGAVKGPTAAVDADLATFLQLKQYLTYASPVGIIHAWAGTLATIPAGFALCNGQTVNGNTTPNLTDRFIMGAGLNYNPGAFGGSVSHDHGGGTGSTILSVAQMPSHAHSVYDPTHIHALADPGHSHYFYDTGMFSGDFGTGAYPGSSPSQGENYEATQVSYTGVYMGYAATGISIYANGGGQGHNHTIASVNHLNPFYALAFIMRVKYPWEA